MTKHTSWVIALTATTFLSAPAIAASLTPTLGENSVFSYSEGSENDYNFTLQEPDTDGKLTTKYYKIDLKPEAFATSKNVSWAAVGEDQKDAADVVAVKLPNDQTKYFKYTYTPETDRTVYSVQPENLSGNIDADFVMITTPYSGAIYNFSKTLGNITGDFIGNHISPDSTGQEYEGGAIWSNSAGIIGDVMGDFIGNNAPDQGGAIYNLGTIGNIVGNFVGNYTYSYGTSCGGAVYNYGSRKGTSTIQSITGNFISNRAQLTGGAIYNYAGGNIGDITGNFIDNSVSSSVYSNNSGGAIYNSAHYNTNATIKNIIGDFIGNYVYSASAGSRSFGGAIHNNGDIGDISGNFINNYVSSNSPYLSSTSAGGAIYNQKRSVYDDGSVVEYGGTIGNIKGNFIRNYVSAAGAEKGFVYGGAIFNEGVMGNVSANFIDNYAQTTQKYLALGGAVFSGKDITLISEKNTSFFSGNYTKDDIRGKHYNALYLNDGANFTLKTVDSGRWVINDNVEGGSYVSEKDGKFNYNIDYTNQYNITLIGDDTIDAATGTTTQYVAMNNDIINAGTVTVNGTTLRFGSYQHEDQTAKNWDGKGAFVASLNADGTANRDAAAVTSLSLTNAVFDIANGYLETVKLKGYSATDSFMHIDVDVENMKADELHVAGNVEGVTKMIVHASSNADIRGKGEILFAQSENDSTGNAGSFIVSRVYKSPYLFDVKYDQIAENSNKWFFEMNDQDNPDKEVEPEEPDVPEVPDVPTPPTPELPDIPSVKPQPLPGSDRPVAPEVIGAESLPAAALAQNSNMVYNIMNKVSANRLYCPGCGFYDYYWNGEAFHNLWANAVYNTLRIKTPTDIDAEVWGLEAGGDLQHDLNNKLGLFLSYRKGNYDMNGDGKHHYSTIGSEIDIDSYLAGLYYRYDRNNWWTFATVYGGIQRVDLKTKDGIKSDTDGTEFGGSVELGYDYALNKTVYLTPSVGAFYTQVDYDDATDSAGKVAKYNTLRQLELEAGVKLTKAFVMDEGYANLYVKPSVVQTVTDGDEVRITGLGKVNTIDDQTLGRIEIGGRYGFTEQLSAYGWANHTFGDDYKASTFGLGLSYSW